MLAKALWCVAMLAVATAQARAEPTVVHGLVDPLTFANRGYGVQLGVRVPQLRGVVLAIDTFALHVPDVAGQLGGNDGFDVRLRPSVLLYALYQWGGPRENGPFAGISVRNLRWRYGYEGASGTYAEVEELSPELVAGYQWHPFHDAFFVQPLASAGISAWHRGSRTVAGHTYEPLPVSPFVTVNIGWEISL